jgi:hypothetical protein
VIAHISEIVPVKPFVGFAAIVELTVSPGTGFPNGAPVSVKLGAVGGGAAMTWSPIVWTVSPVASVPVTSRL